VAVWLIGLIKGQPAVPAQPWKIISELDHLSALQRYDPQQAAQYRAELGKQLIKSDKDILLAMYGENFPYGRWGRQRQATLHKLILELYGS